MVTSTTPHVRPRVSSAQFACLHQPRRRMSLPDRTKWVADRTRGWQQHRTPDGVDGEAGRWLAFAIIRTLVPDQASLAAAFEAHEGQPRRRLYRGSAPCLVSRQKAPRLRILEGGDGGADPLARLRLPAWLVGGHLKWRKDRWAYAPRTFPRTERRRWHIRQDHDRADVDDLKHAEGPDPEGGESEGLQAARMRSAESLTAKQFTAEPFMDAHIIVHSLVTLDYTHQPGEGDTPMTCHWGCMPSTPQDRARCLQHKHLGRFSAKDNSAHAQMHSLGILPPPPPS